MGARPMKKTEVSKTEARDVDDLRPSTTSITARPGRIASRDASCGSRLVVTLDPEVSEVFTSAESVNTVLRALIASMPPIEKKTTS